MSVGFVSATSQSTVYVISTTVDGTRAALAAAIPLSFGSSARRVLLVPQIVPYPLAVDGPVDSTTFTPSCRSPS